MDFLFDFPLLHAYSFYILVSKTLEETGAMLFGNI